MAQEPGPRGSPQVPHALAPLAGDFEAELFPTAKTDNCCSSFAPWQAGQVGGWLLCTSFSNWWPQSWHRYSKIGMGLCPSGPLF